MARGYDLSLIYINFYWANSKHYNCFFFFTELKIIIDSLIELKIIIDSLIELKIIIDSLIELKIIIDSLIELKIIIDSLIELKIINNLTNSGLKSPNAVNYYLFFKLK